MVKWRLKPRDPPESMWPLSPGRLGMVVKKSFGDFRVSDITDEGQLCYTEEGGWAMVWVHAEAARVLNRIQSDSGRPGCASTSAAAC